MTHCNAPRDGRDGRDGRVGAQGPIGPTGPAGPAGPAASLEETATFKSLTVTGDLTVEGVFQQPLKMTQHLKKLPRGVGKRQTNFCAGVTLNNDRFLKPNRYASMGSFLNTRSASRIRPFHSVSLKNEDGLNVPAHGQTYNGVCDEAAVYYIYEIGKLYGLQNGNDFSTFIILFGVNHFQYTTATVLIVKQDRDTGDILKAVPMSDLTDAGASTDIQTFAGTGDDQSRGPLHLINGHIFLTGQTFKYQSITKIKCEDLSRVWHKVIPPVSTYAGTNAILKLPDLDGVTANIQLPATMTATDQLRMVFVVPANADNDRPNDLVILGNATTWQYNAFNLEDILKGFLYYNVSGRVFCIEDGGSAPVVQRDGTIFKWIFNTNADPIVPNTKLLPTMFNYTLASGGTALEATHSIYYPFLDGVEIIGATAEPDNYGVDGDGATSYVPSMFGGYRPTQVQARKQLLVSGRLISYKTKKVKPSNGNYTTGGLIVPANNFAYGDADYEWEAGEVTLVAGETLSFGKLYDFVPVNGPDLGVTASYYGKVFERQPLIKTFYGSNIHTDGESGYTLDLYEAYEFSCFGNSLFANFNFDEDKGCLMTSTANSNHLPYQSNIDMYEFINTKIWDENAGAGILNWTDGTLTADKWNWQGVTANLLGDGSIPPTSFPSPGETAMTKPEWPLWRGMLNTLEWMNFAPGGYQYTDDNEVIAEMRKWEFYYTVLYSGFWTGEGRGDVRQSDIVKRAFWDAFIGLKVTDGSLLFVANPTPLDPTDDNNTFGGGKASKTGYWYPSGINEDAVGGCSIMTIGKKSIENPDYDEDCTCAADEFIDVPHKFLVCMSKSKLHIYDYDELFDRLTAPAGDANMDRQFRKGIKTNTHRDAAWVWSDHNRPKNVVGMWNGWANDGKLAVVHSPLTISENIGKNYAYLSTKEVHGLRTQPENPYGDFSLTVAIAKSASIWAYDIADIVKVMKAGSTATNVPTPNTGYTAGSAEYLEYNNSDKYAHKWISLITHDETAVLTNIDNFSPANSGGIMIVDDLVIVPTPMGQAFVHKVTGDDICTVYNPEGGSMGLCWADGVGYGYGGTDRLAFLPGAATLDAFTAENIMMYTLEGV